MTALFGMIQHIIHDLGYLERDEPKSPRPRIESKPLVFTNLDKTTGIISHQISNHKGIGRR